MPGGLWSGRCELCGAAVRAGALHPAAGAAVEDVGVPASRDDRVVYRVAGSEDHLGILSERPRPGQPAPAGIASGARQRLRPATGSLSCPWVAAGEGQHLRSGGGPGAFRALARPGLPGPGIVQLEWLGQERRRRSVARRGQQGVLEGLACAQPVKRLVAVG